MPSRMTYALPTADGQLYIYSVSTTKSAVMCRDMATCAGLKETSLRLAEQVPPKARRGIAAGEYFNSAQVMIYRGSRPHVVLGNFVKGLNCECRASPASPPARPL